MKEGEMGADDDDDDEWVTTTKWDGTYARSIVDWIVWFNNSFIYVATVGSCAFKWQDHNNDAGRMEGSSSTMHKDVGKEKKYWDEFYSSVSNVPVSPSQFCVFVSTAVDKGTPIVEFGCGNGRDSFFFALQGFPVFASDVSTGAIGIDQRKTGSEALFFECDCTDDAGVADLIKKARKINATIAV